MLAVNAATRGVRPLRHRLAVTSSHIVLTEPVPDVLERIGWTGGESITDCRTFVHYFRTTDDGRILFGWGGGPLAFGARLNGRVERDATTVARTADHLREYFPQLEGRAITHAWGGPIDVSPSHLPQIGTLDGAPVHYAFGFTGNGVGPSHLAGRILAALAAGETPAVELPAGDPPPVPPEPLAWVGRDGRARRVPARRAPRGAGPPRRPAHPRRVRRAEGARHPRQPLIRSATVWRTSASPSFFSSPLGGNNAWRPRSRKLTRKKEQEKAQTGAP